MHKRRVLVMRDGSLQRRYALLWLLSWVLIGTGLGGGLAWKAPASGQTLAPSWLPLGAQVALAAPVINEATLRNVDAHTATSFFGLRYNRSTRTSVGFVTVTNTSSTPLPTPLYLVITALTPSTATMVQAHGQTLQQRPYYDLSPLVSGPALAPQVTTARLTIEIQNPTNAAIRITAVVLQAGAPLNRPPLLAAIGNRTVQEGERFQFTVTATDPDGDQVTLSSSPLPANASFDLATGAFVFQPDFTQAGSVDITFTATDNGSPPLSSSEVVRLTVLDVSPPAVTLLSPADGTLTRAPAQTLMGTVSDSGVTTVTLQHHGATQAIPVLNGAFSTTLTLAEGRNILSVSASNAAGVGTSPAVQVTLDTLPPQVTITTPADTTVLLLPQVRVAGTLDDNAARVTVNGREVIPSHGQWEVVVPLVPGANTITVVATDVAGNTSQLSRQVVHLQNHPPVITSPPVTAAQDRKLYQYLVVASDPDGDPVSFALTQFPTGMIIDSTSGVITWAPSDNQRGQHQVTVEVSDSRGDTATQTFVLAVVDRTAPVVNLVVPSQVVVASALRVTAQVMDNVGVQQVSFSVDGLHVKESTVAPHYLDYNAPAEAGQVLAIRVVALDAAGNAGEATAQVAVTAVPDTTPPVIRALLLPPTAAPGTQVTVRAEVTDDRGVAEVRFLYQGSALGTATAPPYEAVLPVPVAAPVNTPLVVEVVATDTAGNVARTQGALVIGAAPDTAPPAGVVLEAPLAARAGQLLRLTASAVDDVGLLKVVFVADGVQIGEDAEPPYEATYPLSASQAVGSQVTFQARAVDFSNNQTDSAPVLTWIIAPGEGFVVGEVYDDTTGLPVSGAVIRVIIAGSTPLAAPPATTTDGRGRYGLPLPEGVAALEVLKAGYTSVYRQAQVLPDAVTTPLDARLSPLGSGQAIPHLAGGTVSIDEGRVRLDVPPGAFGEDLLLTLTVLSGQGLPAPLPLGWAPVFVVHLGPTDKIPQTPLTLTLHEAASAAAGSLAAYWDSAAKQWLRIDATPVAGTDRVEMPMPAMGTVALVRADVQPAAPPVPEVGQSLSGVPPRAIPDGVAAEISPHPQVLFIQPGVHSRVAVELQSPQPLPSGTPIQVDFRESYTQTNGTRLHPEPMTQDFLLYQQDAGLQSHFVAGPSAVFDPALLQEGVIRLHAHRPAEAPGRAVLGPSGGEVRVPDAASLILPPAALQHATPVSIVAIAVSEVGLADDPHFVPLAAVALDFGGARLTQSGVLTLPLPDGVAEDTQILVLHPVHLGDVTHFELVGLARVAAGVLTLQPDAAGLPLPGVREGGRYVFVRMTTAVALVTGAVRSGGTPAAPSLVRVDTLPFVSLTDVAEPFYTVAATLGNATVTGLHLDNGSTAAGIVFLSGRGETVPLDLDLVSFRPTVVAMTPAEHETGVPTTVTVSVQVSRPLDPASLQVSSVTLAGAGQGVAGAVRLLPDRTRLVFQPGAPLAGNTLHTLRLSSAIRDTFGNPVLGNQPDGSFSSTFTTVDTTPPPQPEAGRITLSIPSDGTTEVTGTQGTLVPGDVVFLLNRTRGVQTAAQASANGGFFATLAADRADDIRLILVNAAGVTTALDPIPFADPDGTTILGPRGGAVAAPSGLRLSLLPHALVRTEAIRLTDVPSAALASELPVGLTAVQAFRIEVPEGSFNAIERLDLSETGDRFPQAVSFTPPHRLAVTHVSPGAVGPASRFTFTAHSVDLLGVVQAVAIDTIGLIEPCFDVDMALQDTAAPRLRLTAPTCLGPSQAFRLEAAGVQPRFELAAPLPPGTSAGETYLVLRRVMVGGSTRWVTEELAVSEEVLGALRVGTQSRTPFGIRSTGEYVLTRAAEPLAFVEGTVPGGAALVTADGSLLAAATRGNNGAFLLPIPANQAVALQVLAPETGAVLASVSVVAGATGATTPVDLVGPAAPAPLTVTVHVAAGEAVAPTAELVFAFSEPLDAGTVVPTHLVLTDARDRLVAGDISLRNSGATVAFRPRTPWRFGETYSYRVTTAVLARSGARLSEDVVGHFAGFTPRVVGTVPGSEVKDAVGTGATAYLVDGHRVRSVHLVDPTRPVEGTAVAPSAPPRRLALAQHPSARQLLVTSGSPSDYGRLTLYRLDAPLAPVEARAVLLSTPAGAPVLPNVPTAPGQPAAMALLDSRVIVSNPGIGLQSVPLEALLDGGTPEPPGQFPPEGASFTDITAGGAFLVSVGSAGVQVHEGATLAPLAAAVVTGTPLDVVLAEVDGRMLALVAAGLPGGLQVFEIAANGMLTAVAKVLPGCAVTRVVVDAPLRRAWLGCSNARLWSLDLSRVDGLKPIDRDGDGVDDRLAGSIVLPAPPVTLSLDAPRSLGLVAAGPAGLVLVQLGPVEAVIVDVVRDPVPGDHQDEASILVSGRAFFGDHRLRVVLETRIPLGHAGLRAVLEGNAPLTFEDGTREHILDPGHNELALVQTVLGEASVPFQVRVVDAAGISLASFAGSLEPVPLDALVSIDPAEPKLQVADGEPAPIAIFGIGNDDTVYNLTALTTFEVTEPAIGTVTPDGKFQAHGGGTTTVLYRVAGRTEGFTVRSSLPPVVSSIELSPPDVLLRTIGATADLTVSGIFTDESRRPLAASAGVVFASSDQAVVTVSDNGTLTAVGAGTAQITVTLRDLRGFASAEVDIFVAPDIAQIRLDMNPNPVFTDEAVLFARVLLEGTGSRDNLPVSFRLEGLHAAPVEREVRSGRDSSAFVRFDSLLSAGTGTLTASVVDPADGTSLTASLPVSVIERNRDAEPNNTQETAVVATLDRQLSGAVGNGDPADVFRLDLDFVGALTLVLGSDGADVRLRVSDAAGQVLAEAVGGVSQLSLAANAAGGPIFLTVLSESSAARYVLRASFKLANPVIDAIEPASGQPGDMVTIRGRGFALRPSANLVFFERLRTEVVSASAEALRVVVPAFATDGLVKVWVKSKPSNEVTFTTGVTGNWWEQATLTLPDPADMVVDAQTGSTFVRNRVEAAFRPHVIRSQVQALAQSLGATIVGVWPPSNAYTLAFEGLPDTAALFVRLDELRARPDVKYAVLAAFHAPSAFPVSARDNFPDRTLPGNRVATVDARLVSAWSQIRAFEAWQAVADSGRFRQPSDFHRVQVALFDTDVEITDINRRQIEGTFRRFDRLVWPAALGPLFRQDHGTHILALIGARNVGARNVNDRNYSGRLSVPMPSPFIAFLRKG